MRRFICFLFIFSFLYLKSSIVNPVFADYQSAYQDYVYNYELYRQAENDFQIAKSTYQTYRTLTSQNDAVVKFRAVLKRRDQVIAVYYNLLQEKMNATAGVSSDSRSTFNAIKASQKAWLSDHQTKIDAASTFDDLNSASSEFESRYPQIDTETKQAVGTVLLAKEAALKIKLDDLLNQLTDKIAQIRGSGQDTSTANRGLISAKSKLDLYQENYSASQAVFQKQDSYNSTINLLEGQQKLTTTNQYLRETVSYLLEIIKGLTG